MSVEILLTPTVFSIRQTRIDCWCSFNVAAIWCHSSKARWVMLVSRERSGCWAGSLGHILIGNVTIFGSAEKAELRRVVIKAIQWLRGCYSHKISPDPWIWCKTFPNILAGKPLKREWTALTAPRKQKLGPGSVKDLLHPLFSYRRRSGLMVSALKVSLSSSRPGGSRNTLSHCMLQE